MEEKTSLTSSQFQCLRHFFRKKAYVFQLFIVNFEANVILCRNLHSHSTSFFNTHYYEGNTIKDRSCLA